MTQRRPIMACCIWMGLCTLVTILKNYWRGVEMIELVVHCKKSRFDVYIGRPSKWGNPFKIGIDGDREQVIEKYRKWLLSNPALLRCLSELKGKVLGCWCKPDACHGDVLVEYANSHDKLTEDLIEDILSQSPTPKGCGHVP